MGCSKGLVAFTTTCFTSSSSSQTFSDCSYSSQSVSIFPLRGDWKPKLHFKSFYFLYKMGCSKGLVAFTTTCFTSSSSSQTFSDCSYSSQSVSIFPLRGDWKPKLHFKSFYFLYKMGYLSKSKLELENSLILLLRNIKDVWNLRKMYKKYYQAIQNNEKIIYFSQ